jgi:hypothetical protein
MLHLLNVITHTHVFLGGVTGALAAFTTDVLAFRRFQSWHDLAEYSWGVASFRWVQGFVLGLIGASVWGAAIGTA